MTTAAEQALSRSADAERTSWIERVDWHPWRVAVIYVVVSRVAFAIVAIGTTLFFAAGQGPNSPEGFLDIWARWDARHFLVVAEHGWTGPEALSARAAAFFPFYPLGIRGLDAIGVNPILAGLLISGVATVVACAFLIKLVDEELGGDAGRRAALYLILFPTGVFLMAPYSEALFMAGAIAAFYYARRGRWLMAAIPLGVATGTRAAGIFLMVGLAVELIRQLVTRTADVRRRAIEGITGLILGAMPLVAYGLFLQIVRGNFRQYYTDQLEGWGRQMVGPIQSFLATWNTRSGGGYPTNWIFAWRIEILAALAGVLLTVWALVKKEWGYAAFMGTFMATLMSSAWYFSIPRMLLSFFPAAIFLAEFTRGREERHEVALLILAPIATMGVIVFTRGAWFF